MKVYSISNWAFYGICILIILLPVSLHWKLLVNGSVATGTVGNYTRLIREIGKGNGVIEYASAVSYTVEGIEFTAYGPRNYEYDTGRTLKVVYDPENPGDNCIISFSGFYLTNYSALPLVLLTVWYAFYLSFNRYSKRKKSAKHIDSQYRSGDNLKHISGKV